MNITIFGSGFVGLVTGTCLAEVGNEVLCVDIDTAKVESLNLGKISIHEPDLVQMVKRNLNAGRLRFSTDIAAGVKHGMLLIIAVGTPSDARGCADLSQVIAVAEHIGQYMIEYRVVVNKPTVPVGTADQVRTSIESQLKKRGVRIEFDVVANPEFLQEGAAVVNFMKPARIIIGTDNPHAAELVKAIYAPFSRNHEKVLIMDVRSAELTKYAANAMLATKISFMNEMANIAERCGADIEKVRLGVGSDPRIGYQFIFPGCGYGGSCFPKDLKALVESARQLGVEPRLLAAVDKVNEVQKRVLLTKIKSHFGADLSGLTFALWGLAFKPNTDDMSEAPSCVLVDALLALGATVRAHDPEAMDAARQMYGTRNGFELVEQPYMAVIGADALVIVTEWLCYRSIDCVHLQTAMKQVLIFDGRNMFDPDIMADQGVQYYAIGRGISEYTSLLPDAKSNRRKGSPSRHSWLN